MGYPLNHIPSRSWVPLSRFLSHYRTLPYRFRLQIWENGWAVMGFCPSIFIARRDLRRCRQAGLELGAGGALVRGLVVPVLDQPVQLQEGHDGLLRRADPHTDSSFLTMLREDEYVGSLKCWTPLPASSCPWAPSPAPSLSTCLCSAPFPAAVSRTRQRRGLRCPSVPLLARAPSVTDSRIFL